MIEYFSDKTTSLAFRFIITHIIAERMTAMELFTIVVVV